MFFHIIDADKFEWVFPTSGTVIKFAIQHGAEGRPQTITLYSVGHKFVLYVSLETYQDLMGLVSRMGCIH